jgi:type IV secretion system protein VirB1
MLPGLETLNCQNMAVPMEVMQHVVHVESSYNSFAIGVVGGRLVRQPKNLPEALATVKMLETRGYNFSLGLAQVNRYNLSKYGLDSYEKAFQACPNLKAGSAILAECYHRLGGDWGKSFSCYYSGNSITGFRHGYVQKIYSSMRQQATVSEVEIAGAIPVVSKASRREVVVSRYPLYAAPQSRSEPIANNQSVRQPANIVSTATSKLKIEQTSSAQSKMQRIIASYVPQQIMASPLLHVTTSLNPVVDSKVLVSADNAKQPANNAVQPVFVSADDQSGSSIVQEKIVEKKSAFVF